MKKILLILALSLTLTGCVGTVVGTAADVAIEVAKVPFKVGGAVIDVVSDDDEEEKAKAEHEEAGQAGS